MRMETSQRDRQILKHIVRYCDEVAGTLQHFGMNQDDLPENYIFRNALSKPIEEIGELAGHLTEDFKEKHPEIAWRSVKGMRNWFAHQYNDIDYEVVWNVATVEVPEIKRVCESILAEDW